MGNGENGKFRVAWIAGEKKHIKLYFENEKDLHFVEEVHVVFNKKYKPVTDGKLYSYQKVKQAYEKGHDSGYGEGYGYGYADGLADGANEEKARLERIIADLTLQVAEAHNKGWREHKALVEKEEVEKQARVEQERLERSRKVATGGGRKQVLTAGEKAKVRRLKGEGKSYREIERILGYKASPSTIGKVVRGEL